MEKNCFTQALESFTSGPPAHRILLAPSRSVGQRLLALTAREGVLVTGVTAHSLFTLAMELCTKALAGPHSLHLQTRLQTEQTVQQLLRQLSDNAGFDSDVWQGNTAARAVWHQLEDGELACSNGPDDNRLCTLHSRLNRYLQDNGLLSRPMLYRLAIECLQQDKAVLPTQAFARLDCVRLTPLEQKLWDILTKGQETVLPLPDGTIPELATQLKPRCRFVACRGTENEIRWILNDLASSGIAPDCAAVAVSSSATALQLWQEGQRTGLAVAVDGGIPLTDSPLASMLRGLDIWRQHGYEAEGFIDLLANPSLSIQHPAQLIQQLRHLLVARGKNRYELLWTPQDQTPDALSAARSDWKNFFSLLFAALTPDHQQKQALTNLLATYSHITGAESAAALAQIRSLLAQLEPMAGQDLLTMLLDVIDNSRYLSSGPQPGALFCASFAQCLGYGAEILYVTGLSATELASPPKPLPFGGQPVLSEEPRTDQLKRLLFLTSDRVVLLRPSYTVEDLLEQPPALLYTQLLQYSGAKEESFGFTDLPTLSVSPSPVLPTCEPPKPASGVFPDFPQWLSQTPLSATALETAILCPYRFMLQYVLKITVDQPLVFPRSRWLEPNALGTLVHNVLQAYFDPQNTQPPNADEILRQQVDALCISYPPANRRLMDADIAKAQALVEAGTKTLPSDCKVLATELHFGGHETPLIVQVGTYSLSISGSIDRLDCCSDGSLSIVDYKTGSIEKYRTHPDHYVQPLLYTLAAEALRNQPGAVHTARYEGLTDTSTFNMPMTPPDRELAIKKLEAFLDYLCRTIQDPPCNPCLEWKEKAWIPGSEKERTDFKTCSVFCPYKNFCPAKGGSLK